MKKTRIKTCVTIGIILMFAGTCITPVISKSNYKKLPSTMSNDGTPHYPISISGNDDFTTGNGVTGGNGTAEDPYRIEDWLIDTTGSWETGISIQNTDAYFIIRDCSVNRYREGIWFSNVTHGTIAETTMYGCEKGIRIWYSREDSIHNCSCAGYLDLQGEGIDVYDSSNITIGSSQFSMIYEGISIAGASDIIVENTKCHHNTNGMTLGNFTKVRIEDCEFSNNTNHGLYLGSEPQYPSDDIKIQNCTFFHQIEGIVIKYIHDTNIEHCVFQQNMIGVTVISGARHTSIRNCSFFAHISTAVKISGLSMDNNELSYCNFFQNGERNSSAMSCAIFLSNAWGVKIHHCNIMNNTQCGVYLFHSRAQITMNNIVHNGRNYPSPLHGGVMLDKSFVWCDLRQNWWGVPQGPNINISFFGGQHIIQLWKVDDSDTVLFTGIGFARLKPWLSEPIIL